MISVDGDTDRQKQIAKPKEARQDKMSKAKKGM